MDALYLVFGCKLVGSTVGEMKPVCYELSESSWVLLNAVYGGLNVRTPSFPSSLIPIPPLFSSSHNFKPAPLTSTFSTSSV